MSYKLTRRNFLKISSAVGLAAGMAPFISCSRIKKEPPNILFLYTDQQHGFTISENKDYQFETPHIDSIAENGITFTNSFCSTPQCSPSRAALMTGQYTHRTGVITNETMGAGRGIPLNPATPSIGNIFKNNGYRTVYYGKWHLGGDPRNCGWEEYQGAKGDKLSSLGALFLSSKPQQPFFLFLSYLNPHDIYQFARQKEISSNVSHIPLQKSFEDDLTKKPFPQRLFMQEDQGKFMKNADISKWKAYKQFYREKVKLVDKDIGIVLDALKKSGLSENTLVVFTSDHGDMDAAHSLVFKGPFMYEEMIRVPLIIKHSGYFAEGETRGQMVQNIDLLSTLAEIAGITLPHSTDGTSLVPILQKKNTPSREFIITEYYAKQEWVTPIRSIRTRNWKYNLYNKWGEELYNLKSDPAEIHNLADNEAYKEKKNELHKKLQEWMKASDDYFKYLRATDRSGRVLDV